MSDFKVIVIGGGASGLFCAIELLNGKSAFLGKDILVLEGNDRVAKKLVATGNGQGNLTNENLLPENYYGDSAFIADFLALEKQINLKYYLYNLGIPLVKTKDGKMYPISRQASAVSDIIRANLAYKNCNIQTGKRVTDIKKQGEIFTVFCGKEKFTANNVVIAVGGAVGKQFGTDGSSYILAEKFGHQTTSLYPSLVQLKTKTENIRGLKGLKEVAIVHACDGDKTLKSAEGDLLFTDFGLSGSAIFQVSGALAKAKNPNVKIEFLPQISKEELIKILNDRKGIDCFSGNDILLGILNKRVGQAVCKYAKNLNIESVATALKNFIIPVTGTLGNNYAQVTKGGIKTDKVNSKTMESTLIENLYFAGEVLDVDGDCGGYNLTFAFVSGIVSARSIKQKNF